MSNIDLEIGKTYKIIYTKKNLWSYKDNDYPKFKKILRVFSIIGNENSKAYNFYNTCETIESFQIIKAELIPIQQKLIF